MRKINCAKIIKDTFYGNIDIGLEPVRGASTKKERTKIVNNLICLFYKNCSKEAMESDVAIFSDKGNYLIIEALECFKSGLLEATMVMLRAAIDTALFILTKNKLYKDKASRLRGMSPLFDTSVVDLECVFKIGTVWGKLRSLMKKSGLSDKEINTIIKNLENAREKGNFSAHFYVNHIKDSQKYLEKYNKMKEKALSSEDESKWFEENKQKPHYITYHDAKEAIENSISSLMKLRECAMKDADMIKQD